MNRREMLFAVAGVLPAVCSENDQEVAICSNNGKVAVILSPRIPLSEQQMSQVQSRCEDLSKRFGCDVVVTNNCDVSIAAPYSFRETLGQYSWSVSCQTAEELDRYIRSMHSEK